MRIQIRSAVVSALAIAVLLGVTACSGGSGQHAQNQSDIQLPDKNRAEWVMPLDDYIPEDHFMHLAEYAEALAEAPCMAKAGYKWNVPWQDLNATRKDTLSASGWLLFDVQIAEDWGYQRAKNEDPSFPAWVAFTQEPTSDAEDKQLSTCLDEVRKKEMPILPGSAQLPASLGGEAYEAALQEKTVVQAAARWHECMLPQGVSDLPSSPKEMPSPSILDKFGLNQAVDNRLTGPKVSAAEITLAVTDAKCRESSGWAQKLYDAEWDRQVRAIRENGDALAAVKRQVDDYHDKVMAVIAAHAPAAPASSTVPTP